MFYRAFFDHSPFGFWIIDSEGKVIECNEAFVRISQAASREALLGLNLLTDPRGSVFAPAFRKALGGEADTLETPGFSPTPTDAQAPLRYVFQPLILDGQSLVLGSVEAMSGQAAARIQDLEQTVLALREEVALHQEANDLFHGVVEQNMVGIYIIREGCFRYVNPAFATLFGYGSPAEVAGLKVEALIAPDDRELVLGNLRRRLVGEITEVRYTFRGLRRDGTLMDVEVHGRSVIYEGAPAVIGVLLDITERKRYESELRQHAYYDALTGLPNRTLFFGRLDQALATARRNDQLLAFLFLDLDGFKAVNDTQGHEAGDEVLKVVARRFAAAIRQTDTLARLGGDEFAVVATELIFGDDVFAVADKLLHTLDAPIAFNGHDFKLGVSIGIALFPRDAEDAESLYRLADQAMYEAKQERRGGYILASSLPRVHSPGTEDALAGRAPAE